MASLRQIRQRLRSTQSTQQIMRAMQLVSASKLKRAQGRLLQMRTTMGFLDGLLQRVLAATPSLAHPLCMMGREGRNALVVITSDAGLCGAYNTNLLQTTEAFLRRDSASPTQLIFIGKKGYRSLTKRGYQAAEAYLDLAGRPTVAKVEAIGNALMDRFLSGQVSSVQLVYAQCVSTSVYRPTILSWLPIALSVRPTAHDRAEAYLFEPTPQRVFEDLLPRWAMAQFQRVLFEAFTAEHSARMIAMKNATDNAQEISRSLTTLRNKIRQAAITKELSEIVGTAEALK